MNSQHNLSAIEISKPDSDATNTVPVVFDSPHNGTFYPTDRNFYAPLTRLRATEDTHVEALYAKASAYGATLITANFPRSYIDANRSSLDIDSDLIDGVWPGQVSVSEKTISGIGLIWRLVNNSNPIYTRKLSVAEVQARIDNYYVPYHEAVKTALDNAHKQWGSVRYINCKLCMNELTRERADGFAQFDANIEKLIARAASYALEKCQ